MNDIRRRHPRGATAAGLLMILLVVASPASPSPVLTQQFTGTVTGVDVTPVGAPTPFAVGQPIVLEWSVDSGLPPQLTGLHSVRYDGAVLDLAMTCGPAGLRIAPGGASVYQVFDEQRAYIDGQWTYIDGIDTAVPGLAVETPAGITGSNLRVWFTGPTSVLPNLAIPDAIAHDLSVTFDFTLLPDGTTGRVTGLLGPPTLDAVPATWGRLKSRYAK
jgi:hypothetical protein